MTVLVWVAVGLLGGIGALGRFFVDGVITSRFGRDCPVGTLVVNLSGAALLGFLVGLGFKGDRLLRAKSESADSAVGQTPMAAGER